MSKILDKRPTKKIKIPRKQFVFSSGKGITDAILLIR
jgi:hypothetical protein